MSKSHVKYIVSAIVAVLICLWFFEGRHIQMKVGDFKIYKKDIEYRDKIIKLNYPDEKNSYGLLQLQKSYTNYQIMRNYGYFPIEERLKTEAKRIEEKTKAPEMLQKVKDIFGKDIKAYQRVFVAPAAIDEMIYYNFFSSLTSVQESGRRKTQSLFDELKNSKEEFRKKAESEKLVYRIFEVSRYSELIPVDTNTLTPIRRENLSKKSKKEENPVAKHWLDTILKNLNSGDIITEPIESDDRWMIGKVFKKINKDTFQVELIEIPKATFSNFIEEESKKIPIKTGFFLF